MFSHARIFPEFWESGYVRKLSVKLLPNIYVYIQVLCVRDIDIAYNGDGN